MKFALHNAQPVVHFWYGRRKRKSLLIFRHRLQALGAKAIGISQNHVELGLDTTRLAEARQSLYVEGIAGNVDSGAWDKLTAEIPGVRRISWDDLGHYPQVEDPRRVAEAVEAFWRSIEG